MKNTIVTFIIVVGSVLLGVPETSRAQLQGLPQFTSEYPRTTLNDFVIGPVCLSLAAGPLDLSCNPAFLATEDKRQFRIGVTANDHVSQLNSHRLRLMGNDGGAIVNATLDDREPMVARATTSIWYQREWWAVGVSPFRGGFASSSRNPAYPEVAAYVFSESEIFGKAGFIHNDDPNLHIGIQLRYVQRQFFRREFDLLDAFGNPSLLKIEKQRVLYAEPGVSYAFDSGWASSLSATLTQLPLAQDGDGLEFKPAIDIGFSTAPPFFGRKLRTSTHYSGGSGQADLLARFKWAAIYDFDEIASVSALIGKNDIGIGGNGRIDSVILGLGWKSEELKPDRWETVRVSTFLFEAGLVF